MLRGALEFHSIMESDWPKRNKSHYVTEIVSWLGFADVIFGGDERQLEIRLRSQAIVKTAKDQRLPVIRWTQVLNRDDRTLVSAMLPIAIFSQPRGSRYCRQSCKRTTT